MENLNYKLIITSVELDRQKGLLIGPPFILQTVLVGYGPNAAACGKGVAKIVIIFDKNKKMVITNYKSN